MLIWSALQLSAFAGGCHPGDKWKLVSVEGKVCHAGQPLAGVQVVFWPDVDAGARGTRASGVTAADGRYELRTDAGDLGAVAGKYRVCIIDPQDDEVEAVGRNRRLASQQGQNKNKFTRTIGARVRSEATAKTVTLSKDYVQFDKTPLRAEIQANNPRNIDFDIP